MANRSLVRRRDCRKRGWRIHIHPGRKRISLKDQKGEILAEGSKIVMESYIDGYLDGLESKLGERLPEKADK